MQKPYRTKLESLWNALEHTRPETYVKRLQERGYDGLCVQDSEFGYSLLAEVSGRGEQEPAVPRTGNVD